MALVSAVRWTASWKTLMAGIGGIAAAITHMINTQTIDAIGVVGIINGIGLIFAKDANVTGGTVSNADNSPSH